MTIALDNVVAVVTGAAGGIGRELVKAMKAANAIVIATDLAADAQIEGADHYLKHDVTSEADWRAVAALVQEKYGRLDALVNNAGYSIVTRFEATPLSDFHRVNAINVDSIIIGTQGSRLKGVGRAARLEMEKLFGRKIFLQLWVKVREGWSDDLRALRSLGYAEDS